MLVQYATITPLWVTMFAQISDFSTSNQLDIFLLCYSELLK